MNNEKARNLTNVIKVHLVESTLLTTIRNL